MWKVGSELQSTTLDPVDPVDPALCAKRWPGQPRPRRFAPGLGHLARPGPRLFAPGPGPGQAGPGRAGLARLGSYIHPAMDYGERSELCEDLLIVAYDYWGSI